jgi:hypothetical protein
MEEWIYKSEYFFTSAKVGGEWSALRFGHFTKAESAPSIKLDKRLDGTQNRSGRYGKVKILDPNRIMNRKF